jgi:hypothetical protein
MARPHPTHSFEHKDVLWDIQIAGFLLLMFHAHPVTSLLCVSDLACLPISVVVYLTTLSLCETKYCQIIGRLVWKGCRRKASCPITRYYPGIGWLVGWLVFSCCSHLEHRASVKRFVSLQLLNPRHSIGLLGRVISTSQGRYLTNTE